MANKLLQSLKFPGLSDTYLIPLMNNFAPAYSSTSTYAVGDYCSHDNKFYVCKTAISTAEAWTSAHWDEISVADIATAIGADVDDLKEALTSVETTLPTKADKDGVVASAEQLLSDVGTEDKAPYLFRATPYDSTRVDEEVVGVSVGWNQYVEHGNFDSGDGWTNYFTFSNGIASYTSQVDGSYNLTIARDMPSVAGHKYLITVEFMCTAANKIRLRYPSVGSEKYTVVNTWEKFVWFVAPSSAGTQIGFQSNQVNGATVNYKNAQCVDLTAWFGSTIADYAYTLEQATAGSGVAFIKALLPGGYIPYSAPKMESVSGLSGHKFTGFNAWDEQWEVGSFNDSGNEQGSLADIRSKGYIPALPNTEYYIKCSSSVLIFGYDANKNPVKRLKYGPANSTFTTSDSSICFIRFATYGGTYGTTYKHDICINLSDPAKNGTYEPYKATTYALDSDLTLRGILKMDSDHRVYADGDVYLPNGGVERRYALVDLGTLNYTYQALSGSRSGFTVSISSLKTASSGSEFLPAISAKYSVKRYNDSWEDGDMSYFYPSGQSIIFINNAYTDAATFKTTMSGVYLVYELATPTTETADPYASPQNCAVGGTEEYVYGESGSGIPVGHNSKYQKNMRSELERVSVAVPDAPSSNGTYTLKATVASTGVTYAWVSD